MPTTNKIILDNIDKLNKSCSKNKLLRVFDDKAKNHLERDSPERAMLNAKLKDVLIRPNDRFVLNPKPVNEGYVIDYTKKDDRFPKGTNVLCPRKSHFIPKTIEQLEMIDKAIRGTKNQNFKI